MEGQSVPVVFADFTKHIVNTIKTFNKGNNLEITIDSTGNYFLKIYPKLNESLFFIIWDYELKKKDDPSILLDLYLHYGINNDSLDLIHEMDESYLDNDINGVMNEEKFDDFFEWYLDGLNKIQERIKGYEYIKFNIDELIPENFQKKILKAKTQIFHSSDNVLPLCLKQIFISQFQGINEIKIDNVPVDNQWIFLVGENGFGKTTILQSIFLGLNGITDNNINLLDSKNVNIQVEYKSREDSYINAAIENKNQLIHLAAYGPGRLNLQGASSENAEDRNSSVSYNLFNSDGFLFNINAELVKWALKKDKRFDLVKKTFCTLIPNLADIKLNKETDQIEYIEQEIGTSSDKQVTYQPLPFQKLASGFKSIIALAGDIIIRLSKNQKEAKDPSDLVGIVLIDEIDLHLHPKLQKLLIGSFSKVFPKIQFIVSTHSPIPLLGAPENSMIFKVTRNKADGIQIEEVKIDLKNLTPNLVLTSGIFDMEDFVSVQNEDITQVRTEDSFEEMKHNDEVEKYLKDFEKSDKNFPDELFLSKSK